MNPLLFVPLLLAQADPALPAGVKRMFAPRDAAIAAFLDAGSLPKEQREYGFYVWDHLHTKESAAVFCFTVNAVMSRNTRTVLPRKIADGRLLWWSFHDLAPRKQDFDKLVAEWEKLTDVEPYFRQPIEKAVKKYKKEQRTRKVTKQVKVPLPQYGQGTYRLETQTVDEVYEVDIEDTTAVKTEPGIHAGGAGPLRLLSEFTRLNMPIVRGDWFLATAWSSVEVDGIHGRYYEFAGIEKSKDPNKSDEDLFFESIGADPKAVKRLRSDQRTVMISGVTGKWRQVEAFFGIGTRPEDGGQLVTITHDIKDNEVGAKRHPLLNLIQFEDQAREIIAAKRNGLHLFVLTDGNGKLQAEAPPDVAAWPGSPHTTKRLISGISCVECHGGNSGFNPVENYVRDLARRGAFPVFDFATKADARDVLDRLRGLYDGDLLLPLQSAGLGYANAVDRATWGVFGPKSVQGASAETVRLYSDYFGRLTAARVLREIGYECDDKTAKAAISEIVPPSADEDGRIAALRLGLPIKRHDLHEVFYEIALRDVLKPKKIAADFPQPAEPPKKASVERRGDERIALAAWSVASKQPEEPSHGHTKLSQQDQGHKVAVARTEVMGNGRPLGERASGLPGKATIRQETQAAAKDAAPAQKQVTSWHVDHQESSLEHHAPPGTHIWFGSSHYDGQVDGNGRRYSTVKSLRPGETWTDYPIVVQFPDGTVKRAKVSLIYSKKTVIDWRAI